MRAKEFLKESAGNPGLRLIKLFQSIYQNGGDDAVDYLLYNSPIFADYYDQYEGDIESIAAEVNPKELQVMVDELEEVAENEGLAEMDSQQPTGRYKPDGTRSHSTYGSRDNYTLGDPETTLGPDRVLTAKDAVSHMHKALDRALSQQKKLSPQQVQRNKDRWAARQSEK